VSQEQSVNDKIVVFGARKIRRLWVDDQWFFSVVDIIAALTDSDNPRNYWNMMKARELKQSEVQLSTICVQLKLTSADGKAYKTDCVNTEAAFRIIQSIPSPKAEPFKQWLASVGYQRIQEIENPELAQQRMRELYRESPATRTRKASSRTRWRPVKAGRWRETPADSSRPSQAGKSSPEATTSRTSPPPNCLISPIRSSPRLTPPRPPTLAHVRRW
jgi:prophage antirepressor-like protein